MTDGGLVNNPAHWTNFAAAFAGVTAVLAGFVFVALSVNTPTGFATPARPAPAGTKRAKGRASERTTPPGGRKVAGLRHEGRPT
jgi:hypothetical protein